MVVAHFHSIQESLEAVGGYEASFVYCEMIDDTILDVLKWEQSKNRFFCKGA
jgi:hypothetical protein